MELRLSAFLEGERRKGTIQTPKRGMKKSMRVITHAKQSTRESKVGYRGIIVKEKKKRVKRVESLGN